MTGETPAPTAKATGRTYAPRRYLLDMDDTPAGFVQSLEGGEITGQVVEVPSGASQTVQKSIAGIRYEDFSFQADLSLTKEFYEWITGFLEFKGARKDISILALDANNKALYEDAFYNVMMTGLTFPACDGSNKEPCFMTVRCAPEYTRRRKPAGAAAKLIKGVQKRWLPSNFRLTIDGLDCTHIQRIESLTLRQTVQQDQIGEARDYAKVPGRLEFPNLVFILPESRAKSWIDWADDFILKGNNSPDKEKSGTLEYLSPDLKTVLARIDFFNLGIFQVRFLSDSGGDAVARVQASLYCEKIAFKLGA